MREHCGCSSQPWSPLDAPWYRVAELLFEEDLTVAEIADRLGVDVQWAYSRIYDGLGTGLFRVVGSVPSRFAHTRQPSVFGFSPEALEVLYA